MFFFNRQHQAPLAKGPAPPAARQASPIALPAARSARQAPIAPLVPCPVIELSSDSSIVSDKVVLVSAHESSDSFSSEPSGTPFEPHDDDDDISIDNPVVEARNMKKKKKKKKNKKNNN